MDKKEKMTPFVELKRDRGKAENKATYPNETDEIFIDSIVSVLQNFDKGAILIYPNHQLIPSVFTLGITQENALATMEEIISSIKKGKIKAYYDKPK
jgi:hypothetical protein